MTAVTIAAMIAKAAVAALFAVAWFYVFFIPSGPLATGAWAVVVVLGALIIGYYAQKRHFAR